MSARVARQRGSTLLEVLLSMVVVLVGMIVLFRVLGVASKGSQASQRITQGLARAETVMESIRLAPATVLTCLARTPATNWSTCETLCLQQSAFGATATAQSCVFSQLSTDGLDVDSTAQRYAVVYDSTGNTATSSFVVQQVGGSGQALNGRPWDVQVTVGWNDNGTASATAPCRVQQHCVTMRTTVFR